MRTAIAPLAIALPLSAAGADVVEDQNGLATQFFAGIAVVSVQSTAQVVTTGIAGTLDSVDMQIWKSPGTVNDVTIRILSVTDGVPDPVSTGTLHTTTIDIDDLPAFDGIPPADQLPLTNVDVSDGDLEFEVGDQFAVAAFREGPGAPPWVLWGRGSPAYPSGDGFVSNDQETWNMEPGPYGFRTFVDEGGGCAYADCDENDELNVLDFVCFQMQWQNQTDYADCDNNGIWNILDFICFQESFVKGCP